MGDLRALEGADRAVVAADVPFGAGGLGRHLLELTDHLEGTGVAPSVYATEPHPSVAEAVRLRWPGWAVRTTPLRWHPGLHSHLEHAAFDAAVARRLPPSPLTGSAFVGFAGHSRRSLARAGDTGYAPLCVMAGSSHVDNVARQHRAARRLHPIERTWLSSGLRRRTLAELEAVAAVFVASNYSRDTFIEAGHPADRVHVLRFEADSRYRPDATAPVDDRFVVTYVGRLTVDKGVPLLVDAVRTLPYADLELLLVGGWTTRGMRKWMGRAAAADPRVRVVPGDPLPHLRRSRLHVHPTWEDNLPYAVLEAAACGVPVVMTADTGAQERVGREITGEVVPTGDLEAVRAAIDQAYHRA